ncbi:MAG: chemotaxis protein CheW, partial [Acidobacteriota bacterium]|nr:chemotaxis protein CheW [Acidobacteriota bacterium]
NDTTEINSSEKEFFASPCLTAFALPGEKFIVFYIGETLYGIPSKEVTEIIRPVPVAALPNAPQWILGIINLRGEIVPVVDLQTLWNKNSAAMPKSKFIVLRSDMSSACVAFAVDKLSEMVTLFAKEIEALVEESAPHIFGKAVYKSNVLRLIDTHKLFASLAVN